MIKKMLFVVLVVSLFGCHYEYTQEDYDKDVKEIRQLRKEREEWERGWDKLEKDTRP